jgi:hypothetical protein
MASHVLRTIDRTAGTERELKQQDGQTVVISINLSRSLVSLLALALLAAAFLGYLAWDRGEASASSSPVRVSASSGMRQYYLTDAEHTGGDADGTDGDGAGVCAPGYHFASLWEILDTSGLRYNMTLGSTRLDSGHGPPSGVPMAGWVRTGNLSSREPIPGEGNCSTWGSSSDNDYGTIAALPPSWNPPQDIHVWNSQTEPCNSGVRVWCVED